MNSLCGTHKQNPITLKAADNQSQAEELVEYFYDKIANIRDALRDYELWFDWGVQVPNYIFHTSERNSQDGNLLTGN